MSWQEWEHVKWSWHSDTLAFWTLCVDIVLTVTWSSGRWIGGTIMRVVALLMVMAGGRLGCAVESSTSRAPPPEYMRRSFSEAALAMVSRRPALSLVLAPLEVPHVPFGLWPVAGRHLRQAC